jgi:MinD-like ATPase involved in chromosome partitioning or flagellar assembly
MFGQDDAGPGLGALRNPGVAVEDLLRHTAPGISLLSGGGGGVDATLSSAVGERRSLLRRVSGLYDSFHTVVVDGGSRLESVMAACSSGAARLLCVTTGDRISLAASYALFKVARARYRGLPVDLLVNRADAAQASDLHAVVGRAARSFLATDIGFGGSLPTSTEVASRLQSGESLLGVEPGSGAGTAMAALCDRLFNDRAADSVDDEIVHLVR